MAQDPPMEPELEGYRAQFEAVLADAGSLVEGLTDGQMAWRPTPRRWSVAECLDHVNVTVTKYLPRIEAMIADARARHLTGRGPFRHPFVGQWFIRMMEPPPRRKFRVPGVYAPRGERPVATLLPEFRRLRGELLARIREADGLDLAVVKTTSPAARFFTLTLGQCFGALAAHDRRHLWQARQVVRDPDFSRRAEAE
jgi:hypothetical protein